MTYAITTFYKFTPIPKEQLNTVKQELESHAKALGIIGLTLVAEEGVNATIAGRPAAMGEYKAFLEQQFGPLYFKDSGSEKPPFKRFKVKIKEEIVHLARTDIQPDGNDPHVSPEEWDALLAEDDTVVIDVRNWYETKIGTFKNAVNPKTKTFSEFPDWLKHSGIEKDTKVAIFCTGGIRCEKAAVAMQEQGYKEVYQLDGGVLNYMEKRPNQNFEGECFVFDHRIAVNQELKPSTTFSFCASCGNAGWLEKTCRQCQAQFRMCDDCESLHSVTLCSKQCKYEYNRQNSTEHSR